MKPRLYLETTVPSYLMSSPSRDLIIAGHQQITREWWQTRKDAFRCHVSQLVIDEAAAGDPVAARERLLVLRDIPLLDLVPDVELLASAILSAGVIPKKAATDAAHIAVAAVHKMDFLLTWNCTHIANAFTARLIARACNRLGFDCPVICTPETLLGA
ncbi:MAG: type II toxin-antitoxin system VapC family toxin [Deltaproteobacteria bacterium]|nr:type II toxin-antitoxin system VapC family toxin [Deltaproteobacteria bacterium]